MSSSVVTKRTHEEVSGDSNPAHRPIKRPQLKPPPPKPTTATSNNDAPRPPCILDLPAGVVANVGTFLNVGLLFLNTSEKAADLMTICIVFGPEVAKTVRKGYLETNMNYLEDVCDAAHTVAMDAADGHFDQNPKVFRNTLPKIRARLEQWMSENGWWKDAAKFDPAYHEDNAEAGLPVIFKTFVLTDFATDKERSEFADDVVTISPSGHVDICNYKPPPDRGTIDENYSLVHKCNGTRGTSFGQLKDLLLEEGPDKELQMMHVVFAEVFLNPALMIDLGLLDVLKFQIEELKLDANFQNFAGILFRGPEDQVDYQEGMPLIFHALAQPDKRFFDYLRSQQGLKVNPVLEHDLGGIPIPNSGHTLLHEMATLAIYPLLDGEIDLVWRLRRILEREEVDLEAQNELGFTPLEDLCASQSSGFNRRQYDLARVFLSAGAKVTETALSHLHGFVQEGSNKEVNAESDDSDDAEDGTEYFRAREIMLLLATTQKLRETEER